MKRRAMMLLILLVSNAFCSFRIEAQTILPPSNATPPNLAPQNTQGGSQIQSPGFSVPATVTTGQTTPGFNSPTSGLSTSTTKSTFISAGKGLPGMPGGPRLGAAGGALDLSSDYMTPPVVGPLFCDPALNIPC